MARSVNTPRRTRILLVLALALASTVAASVVSRPSGAASPNGGSSHFAGTGLPWWKKPLSHTVQEEWFFAQQMSAQYGQRWRTALPDKTVLKLYQQFRAPRTQP